MNDLIAITKENALEVFTGEKLDDYLKKIEDQAMNFVPDVSSDKGRKQIASAAHTIARIKVETDSLGKALVTDWKQKSKLVDEGRKKSRDFLDDLKSRVREPLTEWEIAEEARLETEALEKEIAEAYDMAKNEDELFERRKEIEAKEAKLKAEEEARLEVERKQREERERAERDERIAIEAKEKAEAEAKEQIESEKRARIEAELKAEREAKEAKELAEREKQEAIQHEKDIAAETERKRIEKEVEAKLIAERKAENLQHRKKINNEALDCFLSANIQEEQAKMIIGLIASGKIKHITINY